MFHHRRRIINLFPPKYIRGIENSCAKLFIQVFKTECFMLPIMCLLLVRSLNTSVTFCQFFRRYIISMNLVTDFRVGYHSDDSCLFFKSRKLFWQIYLRDKMCEKDYHFNVTMVPIPCSRYRKMWNRSNALRLKSNGCF